jgi:hypothetical protein
VEEATTLDEAYPSRMPGIIVKRCSRNNISRLPGIFLIKKDG